MLCFEVGSRGRVPSMDPKVGSQGKVLRLGPMDQFLGFKADSDDMASSFGPKAGSRGWVLRLHPYAWS